MVGSKFDYIERTKTDGYDRNDWKQREAEAVWRATGKGAPGRILHQQRQRLDQATGGEIPDGDEIPDGNPDMTEGKSSKKLLRSMRRKQRVQMRGVFEEVISSNTPAEDTGGQQAAGQ